MPRPSRSKRPRDPSFQRQGRKPSRRPVGRPVRSPEGEGEPPGPDPKGFSGLLLAKARAAFPDKVGPASSAEPLAGLPYERELEIKNKTLQEYWSAHDLPDKPNQILPSPLPRRYRITTKRRVLAEHGRFRLDFLPAKREAGQARLGADSLLEPEAHGAIYSFLLDKLNTPAYTALGHALNFLVIRGDYHRFAVFFNVHRVNAQVARKAKLLADHLQDLALGGGGPDAPRVASAFLYNDPGKSPFYLDDRAPEGPWKIKRLFGPDTVRLRVGDRNYAFQPTAFCQVNGSILPEFLAKAEQLLKSRPEQRLLDLYCGFGFFSLHLAPLYREVLGIDAAGPAIESAKAMASAGQSKARYAAGRIQAASLARLLPPVDQGPEAILLDPPRQGVEPGVIRELAARKPARVLHVFCDMDTLPREVNQWRKAGFMIAKVVPLDMFPGTDNLEVMVAFIPDRYGILNRIDSPARNPLEGPAKPAQTAPGHGRVKGKKPKST